MNARNPFVFVVGCPRSGTTLLQRMLDHHPMLAVANDTHFIPRRLERLAPHRIEEIIRGGDVPLTPELARSVREYHRFYRLGLDATQAEEAAAEAATYGEYVGALYTRFAGLAGKPLGGEKTPDYVMRLPLLHGLFPRARTVHLIRDGRDVALSMLDWAGRGSGRGPGRLELWKQEPVAVSALWWRRYVKTGRTDGACVGEARYAEVLYSDLIADPRAELTRVSRFLEIPFSRQMLAYHEGKVKSLENRSAKSAWLPPTGGLRDWRTQMTARDIEVFEAIAGDLLDELGMERAAGKISPEIARLASSCEAWWGELHERLERKARKRARRRRTAELEGKEMAS